MPDSHQSASQILSAPLVTVGVPAFNCEDYVAQAIESLLAQTETRFQLLISDNGSTDGTEAICRDYLRRDSRIRYVRHDINRGAGFNWNFVASNVATPYFKWASANDICKPQFLELCLAAMLQDPTLALCYPRTLIIDADGSEQGEYEGDIDLMDASPAVRFRRICVELALNNAQSGVIRSDALSCTGLDRPYPGGDLVLMAELALLGRYHLLPQALFCRRMARNATSSQMTAAELRGFFNPQDDSQVDMRTWRLQLDYFISVLRSPVGLADKCRSMGMIARTTAWRHKVLWQELRRSFQ